MAMTLALSRLMRGMWNLVMGRQHPRSPVEKDAGENRGSPPPLQQVLMAAIAPEIEHLRALRWPRCCSQRSPWVDAHSWSAGFDHKIQPLEVRPERCIAQPWHESWSVI
jgi:hypothetical protein